jgi:hypothetical protein
MVSSPTLSNSSKHLVSHRQGPSTGLKGRVQGVLDPRAEVGGDINQGDKVITLLKIQLRCRVKPQIKKLPRGTRCQARKNSRQERGARLSQRLVRDPAMVRIGICRWSALTVGRLVISVLLATSLGFVSSVNLLIM